MQKPETSPAHDPDHGIAPALLEACLREFMTTALFFFHRRKRHPEFAVQDDEFLAVKMRDAKTQIDDIVKLFPNDQAAIEFADRFADTLVAEGKEFARFLSSLPATTPA